MGAIKDVADLTTQLLKSVKDRQFSAELIKIQGMLGEIQSEQAALHEQRIELMTENAELKQKISELQQTIVDLKTPSVIPEDEAIVSEDERMILIFLAEATNRVTARQIAGVVPINLQRVEYWLGELLKKKMIYGSFQVNAPGRYIIGHEGREYLIKEKLI